MLDFRNNVIYNWGGGHVGYNADKESVTRLNYIDNYLITGYDSKTTGIAYSTGSPYKRAYFAGNYYNGKLPDDPWSLVDFNISWTKEQVQAYKQNEPFESGPVEKEKAPAAYKRVMESGGASLPKRDAVDSRILNDVKTVQVRSSEARKTLEAGQH